MCYCLTYLSYIFTNRLTLETEGTASIPASSQLGATHSAWCWRYLCIRAPGFSELWGRQRGKERGQDQLKANQVFNEATAAVFKPAGLHFIFTLFSFLLGVKSPGPSPTLEGSVQNVELKFCSRATVKCASGTVGAVKVCARTPGVCSCALLKLYCLCRRERVRPTRLFFYFL